MANKVLLKKSSVAAKVPLTTDLEYGELALNYTDGKLYFKNASNVIKSFTIDDSVVTLNGTQTLTNKTIQNPLFPTVGGDEGGEVTFGLAATNTTLTGSVTVDVWQNNLRIFETGGTNRGVFLNLASASAGVGSGLVTTNGAQTLTNKTLTSPVISGTVSINGLVYPSADGTNGQVLSTNGNGQLIFATVSSGGVVVGGYNNSSLTSFPSGDFNGTDTYVGESGAASDSFGVSLLATFSCMDPIGSLQTTDLGVLT